MKVRKVRRKGPDGVVRDYFEADLRYRGKGKRRFFERKEDATACLDQLGRLHKTRRHAPTDHPTVGAFVTQLLEKRRGTCAEATFDVDHTQLGHFASYEVRPGVPLRDVRLDALDGDGDLVLDVLKHQAGQGYAADSVRLLRNAIKQLLDRAVSQGYLLQHPLRDPDTLRDVRNLFKTIRERTPEKVKAMSEDRANEFLAVAEREQSPLFALFALGFGTGPRLSELVALGPDDDVVRSVAGVCVRQVHVCKALPQRTSRKAPHVKRLKNGADYYADIPAQVGRIVDAYRAAHPHPTWLFHTRNGTPFSHEHVQGEFKRLLKLTWPKHPERWTFTPHAMRHSFATHHILAGKPAKWVSRQLGHADVTVTLKVYANAFEMACPGAADEHGDRLFAPRADAGGTAMVKPTPGLPTEPAPVLH